MEDAKIILLDIPWDYLYGRQVCWGIYRYARPQLPWTFAGRRHREWLRHPGTVGIISMRQPKNYLADARRYGLSAVGVGVWSPGREFSGLPYVDVDPKAVGKLAANYFIERGFRNFAMINSCKVGFFRDFLSMYRGEAFVAALRRRKFSCDVFDDRKKYPPCGKPVPIITGVAERARRWLVSLPKPLAVFAIDDSVGTWVCGTCWQTGLRVPEEVAVLGVNDDEMLCHISPPHLSSIQLPGEQVGFEAAKLLDAMLGGQRAPKRPTLLPPMGVVTRQSTDVMAIEDHYVTQAVQFIRENALKGIRVESVTSAVHMSRRVLERRFRKILGRSPFSEIRRVQIEHIKTLLARTNNTLEAIAPECGFDSVTRMNAAFRKALGVSPGAYRKQFRN